LLRSGESRAATFDPDHREASQAQCNCCDTDSKEQLAQIAGSIAEFGFVNPALAGCVGCDRTMRAAMVRNSAAKSDRTIHCMTHRTSLVLFWLAFGVITVIVIGDYVGVVFRSEDGKLKRSAACLSSLSENNRKRRVENCYDLRPALETATMMPTRRPTGSRKIDDGARQEAATSVAIAALTFIADEPERLDRFLALTGVDPADIRLAAREPGFLLGVLEYLASDEALLVAFANQNDIDPDEVMRARDVLAGEPFEP
jgi:hypothetical protein